MLEILFIIIGYLSGSVLFAPIAAAVFGKKDKLRESSDGNPGTANAFKECGFACGIIALVGDILKGFAPVFVYTYLGGDFSELSGLKALVLAAPAIGHAFPVFFGFRGGKAIAVSFGCLFGILPIWQPLILQAAFYVFFSVLIKISPHRLRSIVTYACTLIGVIICTRSMTLALGYGMIAGIVILKHCISREAHQKFKVGLLWTH